MIKQPTANSQQPTANSQQPTANSQQPTANSQQPTSLNAFCLGGGIFSVLFQLFFSLFKPFRRLYYYGLQLDYGSPASYQHSLIVVQGSPLINCIGPKLFQHRPIIDHGSQTFVYHSLSSNHSISTIDHSRPTLDRIGIIAMHGSLMLHIKTLLIKNNKSINN
jgi:hypothetical protein